MPASHNPKIAHSDIAYQQVLEKLPDAVLVLDEACMIVVATSRAGRLLRHEAAALVGTHISVYHPQLEALICDTPGDTPSSADTDIILNGAYVQVLAAALAADGQQGTGGYVVTLRDQTVRRQTETALYAYERRYRTLFENSNDAIFVLDLALTIIIANKQAAKILGMDLADLLQHEVMAYIKPSEREDMRDLVEGLVNGGRLPLLERTFINQQGEEIPTEASLTLVRDTQDAPLHIQMIVRDIRERKQNEALRTRQFEQLAILRQVDEAMNRSLEMAHVLRVGLTAATDLSRADAGFIALTEGETVTIQRVAGGWDPAYIGHVLTYDDGICGRVLETHEPELTHNVHDDAQYRPTIPGTVAQMTFPLISQDRFVGLLELETEDAGRFNQELFEFIQLLANRLAVAVENARLYHRSQQQLNELQVVYEELQQAEALKTDMLHLANHDLKNPLSIMSGYLSVFEIDHPLMPAHHIEYLDAMRRSVKRMDTILDDFLSFDRFNQRIKTPRPVDLCQLLEQAVEEFGIQALDKGHTLLAHAPTDSAAIVQGDAPQLYEAMANLITNAVKYTPDGGRIAVMLERDGIRASFKVIDNGYGVPQAQQEKLFSAFFRPAIDETQDIDGTGLGLYLVKRIIERHHGEIIFESVYGEGSTFGFWLPLADTPQAASEADA